MNTGKIRNWVRRQWRSFFGEKQAPLSQYRMETLEYAVKEGEALGMDVYLPQALPVGEHAVVLLFVHGGGFSEGRRDDPRYVQFAWHMARLGYPVASMSYRLTMKGRSFGCDQPAANKIATFRAAAEDIWDATRVLLEQAPALGLGAAPEIVLCGSSAGAEAVMHAAYWPEPLLPAGFRYAGLIGMAAAIIDLDWITSETALPSALFHGIDDPLVPFGSASHHYCTPDLPGYLLLHGSESIARRLKALDKSYFLVRGLKGGHGWADKPMFDHRDMLIHFLEQYIRAGAIAREEKDLYWV